MQYKIIILFFLISCANYSSNIDKTSGYSSSGFAHIEKNITTNLNNDNFFIKNNKLNIDNKIKINNKKNKKY